MTRRTVRMAGAAVIAAAVVGTGMLLTTRMDDAGPATCAGAAPLDRSGRPSRPIVGLASNFVWDPSVDLDVELATLVACGVTAIREDLLWEVVEPEQGRYDWRRTDAVMLAAARHEVAVLGILGYSSPWASSDRSGAADRHHPPLLVEDFASYASAVAARYGPESTLWRGSSDFRPLLGLEIWNEAWAWWAWRPDPDPTAYAALARAAAEAVDAVAPEVPVLLTAEADLMRRDGSDGPWLESVLDAEPSLTSLIDAYAVHPYPDPRDGVVDVDRVDAVRDIISARGLHQPVWVTEIGWSTATVAGGVSELEQAGRIVDLLDVAADRWPFVERVFVYTWARDRGRPGDIESGFGLRREDGTAKPALDVLVEVRDGMAR